MTENFEVEELRTELEINGQRILLPVGEKTAHICVEILDEARRRLELIKSGNLDNTVSENEICKFFKDSIERLLGKDVVDKSLTKTQQEQLDELAGLLCYIASEIRKVYEAEARRRDEKNR